MPTPDFKPNMMTPDEQQLFDDLWNRFNTGRLNEKEQRKFRRVLGVFEKYEPEYVNAKRLEMSEARAVGALGDAEDPGTPDLSRQMAMNAMRKRSAASTFGGEALMNVVPTAAGVATGAVAGGLAGGGLLSIPFALAGGIAGGMGAAKAQDVALESALGDEQTFEEFQKLRGAGYEQNPVSAVAGGIVPSALAFRPTNPITDLKTLARAASSKGPRDYDAIGGAIGNMAGAGLGAGTEIYEDISQGRDVDWKKAAIAGAGNAVFSGKPYPWIPIGGSIGARAAQKIEQADAKASLERAKAASESAAAASADGGDDSGSVNALLDELRTMSSSAHMEDFAAAVLPDLQGRRVTVDSESGPVEGTIAGFDRTGTRVSLPDGSEVLAPWDRLPRAIAPEPVPEAAPEAAAPEPPPDVPYSTIYSHERAANRSRSRNGVPEIVNVKVKDEYLKGDDGKWYVRRAEPQFDKMGNFLPSKTTYKAVEPVEFDALPEPIRLKETPATQFAELRDARDIGQSPSTFTVHYPDGTEAPVQGTTAYKETPDGKVWAINQEVGPNGKMRSQPPVEVPREEAYRILGKSPNVQATSNDLAGAKMLGEVADVGRGQRPDGTPFSIDYKKRVYEAPDGRVFIEEKSVSKKPGAPAMEHAGFVEVPRDEAMRLLGRRGEGIPAPTQPVAKTTVLATAKGPALRTTNPKTGKQKLASTEYVRQEDGIFLKYAEGGETRFDKLSDEDVADLIQNDQKAAKRLKLIEDDGDGAGIDPDMEDGGEGVPAPAPPPVRTKTPKPPAASASADIGTVNFAAKAGQMPKGYSIVQTVSDDGATVNFSLRDKKGNVVDVLTTASDDPDMDAKFASEVRNKGLGIMTAGKLRGADITQAGSAKSTAPFSPTTTEATSGQTPSPATTAETGTTSSQSAKDQAPEDPNIERPVDRDELARAEQRRPDIPVISEGERVTIKVKNINKDGALQGRYVVVKLDDLVPSHDPRNGFQPVGKRRTRNTRDYTLKHNSDHVRENAANLDPDTILLKRTYAEGGPPIISSDGEVLGGNGRAQMLILARHQHPERWKEHVAQQKIRAKEFGFDPSSFGDDETIAFIADPMSAADEIRAIVELNRDPQKAAVLSERGDALRRSMNMDHLAGFEMRDDETLNQAIRREGADIVQRMVKDGTIGSAQLPNYIDEGGKLTNDGVKVLEEAMRNVAFGSYQTRMDLTSKVHSGEKKAGELFERGVPAFMRIHMAEANNPEMQQLGVSKAMMDAAAEFNNSLFGKGDEKFDNPLTEAFYRFFEAVPVRYQQVGPAMRKLAANILTETSDDIFVQRDKPLQDRLIGAIDDARNTLWTAAPEVKQKGSKAKASVSEGFSTAERKKTASQLAKESPVDPSDPRIAEAVRAARRMGIVPHVFDNPAVVHNAIYTTTPDGERHVYINAKTQPADVAGGTDSPNHFLNVVSHEVLHDIRHGDESAYAGLLGWMKKNNEKFAALKERYRKDYVEAYGEDRVNDSVLEEEVMGKIFEENALDTGFWVKLSDSDYSLFRRVADFFRRVIYSMRKNTVNGQILKALKAAEKRAETARKAQGDGTGERFSVNDWTPEKESEYIKLFNKDFNAKLSDGFDDDTDARFLALAKEREKKIPDVEWTRDLSEHFKSLMDRYDELYVDEMRELVDLAYIKKRSEQRMAASQPDGLSILREIIEKKKSSGGDQKLESSIPDDEAYPYPDDDERFSTAEPGSSDPKIIKAAEKRAQASRKGAGGEGEKFSARPSKAQRDIEEAKKVAGLSPAPGIVQRTLESAREYRDRIQAERKEFGTGAALAHHLADRDAPIRAKELEMGLYDDATKSSYKLKQLAQGYAGVIRAAFTGRSDKSGGRLAANKDGTPRLVKGSKGHDEILETAVKDNRDEDVYLYTAIRRAVIDRERGLQVPFSDDQIKAGLSLANQKLSDGRTIGQVAKELQEWRTGFLDFAQAAGLIDADARKGWEREMYVPYFRKQIEAVNGDYTQVFGKSPTDSVVNQKNVIRTSEGGEAPLYDVRANEMQMAQTLVSAGLKNIAAKQLVQNMKKAKDAIGETIMRDATPEEVKDNTSAEKMREHQLVSVIENGRAKYYKVQNPVWYSLIANSAPDSALTNKKGVTGMLNTMRRWKQAIVTNMPLFVVRNFTRDAFNAWGISREDLGMAQSIGDSIKAFNQIMLGTAKDYEDFMVTGGYQGRTYGTPESWANAQRRLENKHRGDGSFVVRSAQELADVYRRFLDAGENASRLAEFRRSKKAGTSDAEAGWRAKDQANFGTRGVNPLINFFADVIPFLSARNAGLLKLERSVAASEKGQRGKPLPGRDIPVIGKGVRMAESKFVQKAAVLGGMSAMLAAYNWSNFKEDYDRLEDWERDFYWVTFLPFRNERGEPVKIRIPKPFELGAVGTIGERIASYILSNSTEQGDVKKLAERVGYMLTQTFEMPNPINPISWVDSIPVLGETIQSKTNNVPFLGRNIVPPGELGLPSDLQWGADTSRSLRAASDAISPVVSVSPRKTEAWIRGVFGAAGTYAIQMADLAMRGFDTRYESGDPEAEPPGEAPALRPTRDIPVLSDLSRAFADRADSASSKWVSRFYQDSKEQQQAEATIKELRDRGYPSAAIERKMESLKESLSKVPGSDSVQRNAAALGKELRRVESDPYMGADEKRRRIDDLKRTRTKMIEDYMKAVQKDRDRR